MPHAALNGDDLLERITRISPSPALEFVSTLRAVTDPVRSASWRRETLDTLGEDFVARLTELYAMFRGGDDFVEFVTSGEIDQPIGEFIERVAAMDETEFVFLVLGRVYPRNEIPRPVSHDAIETFLTERGSRQSYLHVGQNFSWCDDVAATRDAVCDLWTTFHTRVFRRHEADLAGERERAIAARRAQLERLGAAEFFRQIGRHEGLPEEIPPGVPYSELIYVPVPTTHGMSRLWFGYGRMVVPFDARIGPEGDADRSAQLERLVTRLRAVTDPSRLRVLQLVASNDYRFNGQRVAHYLSLSASVVSRHLKQLRDAGLIEEHSPDNRTIVYRLRRAALDALCRDLAAYVRDEPDAD